MTGLEQNVVYDNYVFFRVNGKTYKTISLEQRAQYGLIGEETFKGSSAFRSDEWYLHFFRRKDIGKTMGTIENINYPLLNGLKVYYYAAYPNDEGICILEMPEYGYEFFACVDEAN